jgi:hypothetical protein
MTGVRRGNPDRRTHQPELDEAAQRLEDFSGHAPTEVLRVPAQTPTVALPVGELDFVGYTTVRDGKTEKYIHRFAKKSRPLLASSHDGTSLHILGGEYEFTEAGIEDR